MRKFWPSAAVLVVAVLAWYWLPRVFGIPDYVFPTIDRVVGELLRSAPIISKNLSITFLEAVFGFFVGAGVGVLVGVAMAQNEMVERALLPYIVASNAIPVVAVAPILVLIVGHGFLGKGLVAAFLCFFPMTINAYEGLRNYDKRFLELFRVFGANDSEFFWKFLVFNCAPYAFVGLKLSATFSVIGAVVAEFVGSDEGLGYGMLQASYSLNTARLFAYLIVACGLGMLMYFVIVLAEKIFFGRYGARW